MDLPQPKHHPRLKPGCYIVAVSGGVDSMVLLDMLWQQSGLNLIVAHADHGIRADANADVAMVRNFCKSHNIKHEIRQLHLDKTISEAEARKARYYFLQQCRTKYKARAIITAHHQDDLIETALINLLRGTGWRGLAPLLSRDDVIRPLLNWTKNDIIAYAATHKIPWREDSTNSNQRYLRNHVRHTLMPQLDRRDATWKNNLLQLIRKQHTLRRTIEENLNAYLTARIWQEGSKFVSRRYMWIMLPQDACYELLQALCKRALGHSLERPLAEAALVFTKVAKPGKMMALNTAWQIRVTKVHLIVEKR